MLADEVARLRGETETECKLIRNEIAGTDVKFVGATEGMTK